MAEEQRFRPGRDQFISRPPQNRGQFTGRLVNVMGRDLSEMLSDIASGKAAVQDANMKYALDKKLQNDKFRADMAMSEYIKKSNLEINRIKRETSIDEEIVPKVLESLDVLQQELRGTLPNDDSERMFELGITNVSAELIPGVIADQNARQDEARARGYENFIHNAEVLAFEDPSFGLNLLSEDNTIEQYLDEFLTPSQRQQFEKLGGFPRTKAQQEQLKKVYGKRVTYGILHGLINTSPTTAVKLLTNEPISEGPGKNLPGSIVQEHLTSDEIQRFLRQAKSAAKTRSHLKAEELLQMREDDLTNARVQGADPRLTIKHFEEVFPEDDRAEAEYAKYRRDVQLNKSKYEIATDLIQRDAQSRADYYSARVKIGGQEVGNIAMLSPGAQQTAAMRTAIELSLDQETVKKGRLTGPEVLNRMSGKEFLTATDRVELWQFAQEMDAKITKALQEDPVAYVEQVIQDPELMELKHNGLFKEYADKSLAIQKSLGVPVSQRRVISKVDAEHIAEVINSSEPGPLREFLNQYELRYGKYWDSSGPRSPYRSVMDTLINEAELDPHYKVAIQNKNSRFFDEFVYASRMKNKEAMDIYNSRVLPGDREENFSVFQNAITEKFDPFFDALQNAGLNSGPAMKHLNEFNEVLARTTLSILTRDGIGSNRDLFQGKMGKAVDALYRDIVETKYDVYDGYYIPKNTGSVEEAESSKRISKNLNNILGVADSSEIFPLLRDMIFKDEAKVLEDFAESKEKIADISDMIMPLHSFSENISDEDLMNDTLDHIKESGMWINTPDGSGVTLVVEDYPDLIPIRNKAGRPLTIYFDVPDLPKGETLSRYDQLPDGQGTSFTRDVLDPTWQQFLELSEESKKTGKTILDKVESLLNKPDDGGEK